MRDAVLLLLGAVIGVLVDRLWSRYEERPRFRISPKVQQTITEPSLHFALEIQNTGKREVSDYAIVLVMSSHGQFIFDGTDEKGPLLPSQKRTHSVTVAQQCHIVDFFDRDRPAHWGPGLSERVKTSCRPRGLTLQLVVKGGDRVLFQSGILGEAFGEMIVETAETGKQGELDWPSLQNFAGT